MSTICKCDKCGRVIERGNLKLGAHLGYSPFGKLVTMQYDLCEACAIDFEAWLKSPLSFAGALHACGADKDKDKGES